MTTRPWILVGFDGSALAESVLASARVVVDALREIVHAMAAARPEIAK